MKNSVLIAFCALLVSGLLTMHVAFNKEISPERHLQVQLKRLNHQRDEAEFRAQLARHQLAEFQQYVATLIPDAVKGLPKEEAYPLRQLASVAGAGDQLAIERASTLFEKAKADFRAKKYAESNRQLVDLIALFPESVHVIEAHFLLAEGQYQLKEYEDAIATIEKMIGLFPESELTGFALLRLGKIFEAQDRIEDAADIYRAVLANFKDGSIAKQAGTSLKSVAL